MALKDRTWDQAVKLTEREVQRTIIVKLEELIRRSLVGILASENLIEIFDGGRREEYLDSLAFR